ncbi:nucleotidyltransferase family protein [Halofilum ochraceum]|uniref:nucleotidyltransferase family protein n=1 Tax=Halofilum ochraceum TaxID=1611323 RepID=UPI00082F7126|nr:nucleotidyltransferase family protein [Halofilum ochraceum]
MITGVLLAAGRGDRFGGDKLSARLPDGRPIAAAAAEAMVASLPRVVAVTRPDDEALAAVLEGAGCHVVVCERADEGMGASLACGVTATRAATGWVIALADMPAIRPATIAAIAATLAGGARLAAPTYHGRRGHPVGFAGHFGPELAALGGDEGARHILAGHQADLEFVEVEDPGILYDIDTPTDLARSADDP